MHHKRIAARFVAVGVAVGLALGYAAAPSWADDDPPPLSQAPGPGDPTTQLVEFTVPVPFATAVSEAATYPGDVIAIRYDNPELTGEYSFASGVTPAAFEGDFLEQYGTTPAATALVVVTTVPEEGEVAARSATPAIEVGAPAFVPAPAVFSQELQEHLTPPTPEENRSSSELAGVSDWRASSVGREITNYTSNRVTFVYSNWWLDQAAPWKVPYSFGVEFEVNLFGNTGYSGVRPFCYRPNDPFRDAQYKSRLAAQNQNWNWRVIRPDGYTAPSSLGAYADYNDLGDDCGKSSISIGLRYPQNIQYVNQAYGIIFVIDAPKGMATTSAISGVNQAVSDDYCTTFPGNVMALTDCMGVVSGDWPGTAGPKFQTTLNKDKGWTAPKRCWNTEFWDNPLGVVYDNTSWMCP